MRQRAQPHPESDRHLLCPFCGTVGDLAAPLAFCTGCGAERSTDDAGEVVFDSDRKADRQTVDEAVRSTAGQETRTARGASSAALRRPVRLRKKGRTGAE